MAAAAAEKVVATRPLGRVAVAIRLLLGLQYLVSGVNWYYKFLIFPSISDPPIANHKHAIVGVMIESGWMFDLTKQLELLTGLALLFNRFVPLLLVASLPVAVFTFAVDAFIVDDIFAWLNGSLSGAALLTAVLDMIFFGGVVLFMQGWLMLSYLHVYAPMLSPRNQMRDPVAGHNDRWAVPAGPLVLSKAFRIVGWGMVLLGVVSNGWYLGMAHQWLIPWSSLRVLAP